MKKVLFLGEKELFLIEKRLVFVVPHSFISFENDQLVLSELANQMIADVIEENKPPGIYSDDEIRELSHICYDKNVTQTDPDTQNNPNIDFHNQPSCSGYKRLSEIKNDKVLKKKKVDSDNEADDTNHYSGDWIVAEFIVQSKKNRYVGQIKSRLR